MFKFGNASRRMLPFKITPGSKRIMLKKSACGLILCLGATAAFAQSDSTAVQAKPQHNAYLQDSRGAIIHNGEGLCWRSGYWTPADAAVGCDGALVPPIARPIAPDIVAPVATAPVAPPTLPARCDFTVTLNNDQTFAFNKWALRSAAKKRIDQEVMGKLASCAKVDLITITGHTDRLGSEQYNQKLSEKRANAVAAYLKNKGATTQVNTVGAGKTQAVKSCDDKLGGKKLVECLAPNRRVVIEIRGEAGR
jgi:OOP family OmpA-OmpF porin